MPQIVEPQPGECTFSASNVGAAIFVCTELRRTLQFIASRTFNRSSQIAPSCPEAFLAPGRVDMTVLACWEDVMLRIDPAKYLGACPWCPSSPSFGNQTKQPVESAVSQTVAIAASILVCCGCFDLYTRAILVAATAFAVGVGSIGSPRKSTLSSDTPRLIRLRRARSVGVIPSIRRKVRVKCGVSENPAL
jgi:hypothetical protein